MKIKLSCGRAGHNFVQHIGDIVDVDPDEAGRIYSGGMGTFVDEADKAFALAASGTLDPSVAPLAPTSAAAPAPAGTLAGDDDDDDDALPDDPNSAPSTALGKAKAKAKAKS
jgi:hypothetical protein